MKLKKILSLVLAGIMALSVTGCVNQHPEETSSTNTATESGEVRLVSADDSIMRRLYAWRVGFRPAQLNGFDTRSFVLFIVCHVVGKARKTLLSEG